jgi:hypothetical protein
MQPNGNRTALDRASSGALKGVVARTVHSASSEQVRRPINREGLDQWRHYEPWLSPLKEALAAL